MEILGLPPSMFLIFAATVLAGSVGAIHFLIWHVILGKPFGDEERPLEARDPAERTTPGTGHRSRTRQAGADPGGPGPSLRHPRAGDEGGSHG